MLLVGVRMEEEKGERGHTRPGTPTALKTRRIVRDVEVETPRTSFA